MIEEEYVSYEAAKLLKEKGFDSKDYERYGLYVNGEFHRLPHDRGLMIDPYVDIVYTAPTLQMAMCWLRQEHNLSVEVYRTACGWIGCVVAIPSGTDLKFLEDDGDDLPSGQYTTHAKACEATIKYCLENLIK
jgi:hypothetical protein